MLDSLFSPIREMGIKRLVFHCPFPVSRGAALLSANLARPVRMLEGFREAGYRVIQITGNARQRRRRIARLKGLMRRGLTIEFVYSETSNLPLFFNEKNRLPLFPFLEYRFFRWLRSKRIPVGLFLRDLHWRFPHFRHYPLYKRLPALLFYRLDWRMYISRCDRLFLPSAGLGEHLPSKPRGTGITVLPPGCENREHRAPTPKQRGLSLFYVGGVTPPLYNLTPIFACAARLPEESVVICCRQDEWLKARHLYPEAQPANVHLVHVQGQDLDPYYQGAHLFLLTLAPYEYMKLAMPFKVFEAVSYLLPVLTFTGTEAARWVQEEDAGWAVPDIAGLIALIGRLRDNTELIAQKRVHLREVARKHSWANRARSVAEALGAGKVAK